jgi:hypothetical protein
MAAVIEMAEATPSELKDWAGLQAEHMRRALLMMMIMRVVMTMCWEGGGGSEELIEWDDDEFLDEGCSNSK